MAGYTRNDTANNIADGNVINAAPLDGEFNAIEAAFNVSSGHTHDGSTTGDGGPVSKLGPSAQLEQTSSALTPSSNNAIDLGTSSAEFKDLYLNGVAYIDKLTVAASNGGTDGVGSHLEPTATATYNLGSSTYAFNTAFVTALNVRKNDAPVVTLTNLSTDMTATEIVGSIIWESLDTQQSGVDLAQIDAVVVDTLDDAGGSPDDQVKLTFKTGNAEALTLAMTLQSDDIIAADDVALRSDSSVLSFGADDDVTLTHVADTALRLNAAIALQFRDSALSIASSTDGQLDIDADTEIEIVAPTLDIDASTTVTVNTTTLAITGATDITGDLDVDNININGNAITSTDTNGNIALTPNGTGEVDISKVDIASGAIDGTIIGGSSAEAGTFTNLTANTNLTLASGATVTAILDEDDMSTDSATALATQQSIKAYVNSTVGNSDLDFQADSGGALSIDLDTETMTFTGGTGIDTSGSGNAVTFAIDNTVTTLAGSQTLTNKSLTAPVLTGSSSAAGSILFKEDTDNGTNAVTLIGPAATTDVTLTLPNVTANTSLAALNLAQEYTASQNFDEQSLSDGANIDWNLQTQQVATVTLGGNRTFNAPSNHVAGLVCILTIVQDGTGSRTATFNSAFKFTGGSAPTLTTTASARDILVFISDGTNLREIGRSLNPS
tara:strand:- start:4010 stop:6013 length:2004 start_codon:yes stop_codon:yes gene_type:complete